MSASGKTKIYGLLDTRRINALGWHPSIRLAEGLKSFYEWFLANVANLRLGAH